MAGNQGVDTTKAVYQTDPAKSHVSHVVADTGSWEQKLAEALEEMPEVSCYVKNQGLNFTIPYTLNGEDRQYYPDFIARIGDLHLIIEVSGEVRKDKAAKVSTADAVGARRQQSRRVWPLGVRRSG